MSISFLVAAAIPASADATTVFNPPSTYVNGNFGPNDASLDNFYRSQSTLDYDTNTADVFAKRTGSEVRLSASANLDPNDVSAAYSAYNIGVVYAGSDSLTSVTVKPLSVTVSGTANWAMNLWFDSNHDGEYFTWNDQRFTGLDGDVYAIGMESCNASTCSASGGQLTIDQNHPLFLIGPDRLGGCNGAYSATLAEINQGLCAPEIPANTPTAMWVGIDIENGVGSGSATIGTKGCEGVQGGGDARDENGNQHHHQFNGNSCDNNSSGVQDTDSQGNSFQSTSVTSSTFTANGTTDIITMVGSGLDNAVPVTFTLVVNDFGVLAPAVYNLTLSDGRTVIGTFFNGDIAFQ